MDATKSFIKVHGFTEDAAEFFEFDYTTDDSDLFTELVPNFDHWGGIGWMELDEYEYDNKNNIANFSIDTKWEAPVRWLQQASCDIRYFENRLITMATIQKDETCVKGVAIMDGEILQEKVIFEMSSEDVGKYYDGDQDHFDLDDLDNQIWDSIAQFVNVCTKFYSNEREIDE
jgi:hypothetical protein